MDSSCLEKSYHRHCPSKHIKDGQLLRRDPLTAKTTTTPRSTQHPLSRPFGVVVNDDQQLNDTGLVVKTRNDDDEDDVDTETTRLLCQHRQMIQEFKQKHRESLKRVLLALVGGGEALISVDQEDSVVVVGPGSQRWRKESTLLDEYHLQDSAFVFSNYPQQDGNDQFFDVDATLVTRMMKDPYYDCRQNEDDPIGDTVNRSPERTMKENGEHQRTEQTEHLKQSASQHSTSQDMSVRLDDEPDNDSPRRLSVDDIVNNTSSDSAATPNHSCDERHTLSSTMNGKRIKHSFTGSLVVASKESTESVDGSDDSRVLSLAELTPYEISARPRQQSEPPEETLPIHVENHDFPPYFPDQSMTKNEKEIDDILDNLIDTMESMDDIASAGNLSGSTGSQDPQVVHTIAYDNDSDNFIPSQTNTCSDHEEDTVQLSEEAGKGSRDDSPEARIGDQCHPQANVDGVLDDFFSMMESMDEDEKNREVGSSRQQVEKYDRPNKCISDDHQNSSSSSDDSFDSRINNLPRNADEMSRISVCSPDNDLDSATGSNNTGTPANSSICETQQTSEKEENLFSTIHFAGSICEAAFPTTYQEDADDPLTCSPQEIDPEHNQCINAVEMPSYAENSMTESIEEASCESRKGFGDDNPADLARSTKSNSFLENVREPSYTLGSTLPIKGVVAPFDEPVSLSSIHLSSNLAENSASIVAIGGEKSVFSQSMHHIQTGTKEWLAADSAAMRSDVGEGRRQDDEQWKYPGHGDIDSSFAPLQESSRVASPDLNSSAYLEEDLIPSADNGTRRVTDHARPHDPIATVLSVDSPPHPPSNDDSIRETELEEDIFVETVKTEAEKARLSDREKIDSCDSQLGPAADPRKQNPESRSKEFGDELLEIPTTPKQSLDRMPSFDQDSVSTMSASPVAPRVLNDEERCESDVSFLKIPALSNRMEQEASPSKVEPSNKKNAISPTLSTQPLKIPSSNQYEPSVPFSNINRRMDAPKHHRRIVGTPHIVATSRSPFRGESISACRSHFSTSDKSTLQSLRGYYSLASPPRKSASPPVPIVSRTPDNHTPHHVQSLSRTPSALAATPKSPYHAPSTTMVCTNKFVYNLHSKMGPCHRCWSLASPDERDRFAKHGSHLRIIRTRGGCDCSCTIFPPSKENEFPVPVRLCRQCFFATHQRDGLRVEVYRGNHVKVKLTT